MNYRKQGVYCLFILAIWAITAFNPISVWATGSPATGIEEAKAAIETARQAGAEKIAQDDMTQARSWLAQAESEYARSRSLLSRSMKLIISDEAKTQEIQYLATMARITGQIAEAKAREAAVAAELKNVKKDLADYQAALDVLNKKSAEAEIASKVKAQAEAEQEKLEQAATVESKKMKELEEERKKVADLEAVKQKEVTEANLKGQQLDSQKAKEEAELQTLRQKTATLDKTKAMLADAVKIRGATVKSIDKEILINIATGNIFSTKNEIHAKGRSTLDEVASYMEKYQAGTVTIRCYSDNVGKAQTQRVLTEKRAQKVKDYLVDFHNISADRIVAKGLGPSEPVAENSTASGRALNRRIEIGIAISQ
jgi:outer membrane protein OmpA-like peptidoglycan-associated protein